MTPSSSTPATTAPASALADAIALIGLPACLLRDDGTIGSANAAWCALRDPQAGTVQWPQLLHGHDCARVQAWLAAGDAGTRIECRIVGTDGTPRWHLLAVHCCPPHGTRVCTATDIHALRQREERLRSRHAIQPTCST